MRRTSLDPNAITVETFQTTPAVISIGGGQGTACFETCESDWTSCPDQDTCADKTNP